MLEVEERESRENIEAPRQGGGLMQQCMNDLERLSQQVYCHYFQSNKKHEVYCLKESVLPLYSYVYNMCNSKPSYEEKMFTLYKRALEKHMMKYIQILKTSLNSGVVINQFNLIWESYLAYVKILSKRIFCYLDRYFLKGEQTLRDVAIHMFKSAFFSEKHTIQAFFQAFVLRVASCRETRVINGLSILKFSESMALLDLTENLYPSLQKIYIDEAEKHYQEIYQKRKGLEPMKYLNFINNLKYFQAQLHQSSLPNLLQVPGLSTNKIELFLQNQPNDDELLHQAFEEILVKQYTDTFLNHAYGFIFFISKGQTHNLKIAHEIYSRYEGFQKIRNSLYEFVLKEGEKKLNSNLTPEKFIQSFYEFYTHVSQVVVQGLHKQEQVWISMNNGIEKLALKFEKLPQILFSYCRKVLNEGLFTNKRNLIMTIFEQLSYKDDFIALYRQSLEENIIKGKLVYLVQKQFIKQLNNICGSQVTAQLDKKLEDYIQSMPESLNNELLRSINFDAKIVSLQLWQKKFQDQMTFKLTLINPMLRYWEQFQNHYLEKFNKRKLTLLPFENKIILGMKMINGSVRLKCNLIQACIIVLLASNPQPVELEQIMNTLTLQKNFLFAFVQEHPDLILHNNGTYMLNWEFGIEGMVDLDTINEEQKKVKRNVEQDRQILIQAAIVKILKREKSLTFELLVMKVCSSIKLFRPHPSMIKGSTEKLIKKDMIFEESGNIVYKQ